MSTTLTDLNTLLSDHEFGQISALMRQAASLHLPLPRKFLVAYRLQNRLRQLNMTRFQEYVDCISERNSPELGRAVDLLTTHETYFFREPQHFDYMAQTIAPAARTGPLRVWSAAAATGEEAYSIAMTLMATLGDSAAWEVLGTDVSAESVRRARQGIYDDYRMELMPAGYRRGYCLRGTGAEQGRIQINPMVRERVRFEVCNLAGSLAGMGLFDAIFLRNVLIYFDNATQLHVLKQLQQHLKPGGWLLLGHAESICNLRHGLKLVAPTVYRQPE